MMSANQSENHTLPARRPASIFASMLRVARRTDGSPIIEFALVFPLMMIMVVGMFGLGIMLNNYMVLTSIVGSAARYLALSHSINAAAGDPCRYAVAQATANSPSLDLSRVTWTVTWTTFSSAGVPSAPTPYTSAQGGLPSCSGQTATSGDNVAVSATYPSVFYQYGILPTSMNLTARSAELMQ